VPKRRVADPLAREFPQVAFEQFQYLRGCQAFPVTKRSSEPVRAVAAPAPASLEYPVGVEKHAVTRPEALRALLAIDFGCETERRAGPLCGELVAGL
jgi:hypothetical protein